MSRRTTRTARGRRKPPSPGTLPKKGAEMLAAVYEDAADRLEGRGVSSAEAKQRAARQAWCAVKRHYYKRGAKWHKRKTALRPDEYPPGCEPIAANPTPNAERFHEGDIVRYTAQFLRSTGQYTPPINGQVIGFTKVGDEEWPIVWWSDREKEDAVTVHPGNIEKDPRARRSNKGKRGRKKGKGRKGKRRLTNAPVIPGDRVKITKGKHPRLAAHQSGTVEDITHRTVWVRLDHSNSLIGVPLDDVKLEQAGPLRNAVTELLESNPAEIVAAAAIQYTDALEEQVRAIRTGRPQEALEARQEAMAALKELEDAAQTGIAVPAGIGAAIGGGIGAVAGPPVAAIGAMVGAVVGSSFARPFRGAERPPEAPPAAAPTREAPRRPTAPPRREFTARTRAEREARREREAARPAPPVEPRVTREEPRVEPRLRAVAPPREKPADRPKPSAAPAPSEVGFDEGFEEFFEEAANPRANNPGRQLNKLKRRLLR